MPTPRTSRAGRERPPLGRGSEIAALAGGGPGLHVLRGAAGSGRSTVLAQVASRVGADGRTVLRVDAGSVAAWDRYGAGAVLDAVRSSFESLAGRDGSAQPLAALDRVCTPAAHETPEGRSAVLVALARLVHGLGDGRPLVLLVDDADALAEAGAMPAAAAAAGHLVVAAVRDDGPAGRESPELVAHADHVVDLPPLGEDDAATLLARHLRRPLAPSVFDAVAAGLGGLAGNPAAILGAADELVVRGRLVDVHGYLAPTSVDLPIVLPVEHPTISTVARLGTAARILLVVTAGAGFAVDGLPALAAASGRATGEYGEVADRLVSLGVLANDAGRLTVTSPAVAATVAERFGHHDASRLHADLVRTHRATPGSVALSPAALADHVVAAGEELVRTPSLVSTLTREAARVEHRDPDLAIARHRAARRHATDEERPAITERFRELLGRTGSYDELADLVAEIVRASAPTAPTGARRSELAALAGLAALHRGTDVAPDVRAALEDPADPACPLRFRQRWSAASAPVSVDDVRAAFRALPDAGRPVLAPHGPDDGLGADERADLEDALGVRDLVPVFSRLFPDAYGPPRRCAAAYQHRLVVGQTNGSWPEALTAAREFVASGTGDTATHELAALFVAEILTWRGDDRAAREWLATIRPDGPYGPHRTWLDRPIFAESSAEEAETSLRLACAIYRERCGAAWPGPAWRLLLRMSVLALDHDLDGWRGWLLGEVRALGRRQIGGIGDLHVAALEPLLRRDTTALPSVVSTLRDRDRRVDVALLCLLAGIVADDPAPWLLEGRAIASDAGAERLLARVRAVMGRRGVTVPRESSGRLTATEHDLVSLVRQGLTNRQIATTLHLSVKTVENNLTRLFAKLGCRTRYGLAALDLDATRVGSA